MHPKMDIILCLILSETIMSQCVLKTVQIYIFSAQMGPQHHLLIPLSVISQALFPVSY